MIAFINKKAVQAEVAKHSAVFDFCSTVLQFCHTSLKERTTLSVVRKDGVDDAVVWVSVTQFVKLWRLGVSVVQLAEAGHSYEAEALVRGMYETQLLIEFVLRRQVRPRENGALIAHGQRPFSSQFRARMYLAHIALRRAKWARSAAGTPGLKRQVPQSLYASLEAEALPLEKVVGGFWAKRLRIHATGLSISALSETLGVEKIYESLYRARSTSVHASDMERFLEDVHGVVSLRIDPRTDPAQIVIEAMALLLRGGFWIAKRLRVLDGEECKRLLVQIDRLRPLSSQGSDGT